MGILYIKGGIDEAIWVPYLDPGKGPKRPDLRGPKRTQNDRFGPKRPKKAVFHVFYLFLTPSDRSFWVMFGGLCQDNPKWAGVAKRAQKT